MNLWIEVQFGNVPDMPQLAGPLDGPDRPAGKTVVTSRRVEAASYHCPVPLLAATLADAVAEGVLDPQDLNDYTFSHREGR